MITKLVSIYSVVVDLDEWKLWPAVKLTKSQTHRISYWPYLECCKFLFDVETLSSLRCWPQGWAACTHLCPPSWRFPLRSGTACTKRTGSRCRPSSSFSTRWNSATLLSRWKRATRLHTQSSATWSACLHTWWMAATFCLTALLTDMWLNIDCSQVAHPDIRDQLVGYIYNGFLVPVLAPALHKVGTLLPSPLHLHVMPHLDKYEVYSRGKLKY